jgi:hypothetical protein
MQQSNLEKSKSFVVRQLGDRSTVLGTRVSQTAQDLRRIASDLRASETVGGTADLADRGADAVDRLGSYLQDADGDRLIADLETFARRRPWAMATAALAAGFAASRVMRASSSRRYAATSATQTYEDAGL